MAGFYLLIAGVSLRIRKLLDWAFSVFCGGNQNFLNKGRALCGSKTRIRSSTASHRVQCYGAFNRTNVLRYYDTQLPAFDTFQSYRCSIFFCNIRLGIKSCRISYHMHVIMKILVLHFYNSKKNMHKILANCIEIFGQITIKRLLYDEYKLLRVNN